MAFRLFRIRENIKLKVIKFRYLQQAVCLSKLIYLIKDISN